MLNSNGDAASSPSKSCLVGVVRTAFCASARFSAICSRMLSLGGGGGGSTSGSGIGAFAGDFGAFAAGFKFGCDFRVRSVVGVEGADAVGVFALGFATVGLATDRGAAVNPGVTEALYVVLEEDG